MLVHDRESGVPTTEDDSSEYVHLRLALRSGVELTPPPGWLMTRRTSLPDTIPGVDCALIGAERAWRLIGDQSAWLLDLVEALGLANDVATVRNVRQFLHYFANMAQMTVG